MKHQLLLLLLVFLVSFSTIAFSRELQEENTEGTQTNVDQSSGSTTDSTQDPTTTTSTSNDPNAGTSNTDTSTSASGDSATTTTSTTSTEAQTTTTTNTTTTASTKYSFQTTTTPASGEDSSNADNSTTYKPSQGTTTKTTVTPKQSSEEESQDAPQSSDEDEQPVIKKKAKKKVYPPEIMLIEPKARTFSNTSLINSPPCGGADKGFVHYITTPGSRNFIQWKVVHPSVDGNCTIRVGQGVDEDDYITLKPRDGSANPDGSFPCGREIGYEGKEVKFPKNYTCDSCTFQFEWTLSSGQIHQCADFLMTDKDLEECAGKCQNGGACINGECKCRAGYNGQYCQYKNEASSKIWLYFLGFTVLILIIVGIFFYTKRIHGQIKNMPVDRDDNPDSIIGTNPEPKKASRFGGQ